MIKFIYLFIRKYYHDDSIMTSSHAFILSDQLTGLTPIDFRLVFFILSFI